MSSKNESLSLATAINAPRSIKQDYSHIIDLLLRIDLTRMLAIMNTYKVTFSENTTQLIALDKIKQAKSRDKITQHAEVMLCLPME